MLDPTDNTDSTSRTDGRADRFGTSRRTFLALAGAGALGVAGFGSAAVFGQNSPQSFTVRIENVSDGMTLMTSGMDDLAEQPVPLSPGAYAVHRTDEPIFAADEPERNNGLEEIAEDGNPERLAMSLTDCNSVLSSGAFTTPVGSDMPAPIGPGGAYEFSIESPRRNTHLSLVTMFVPSNDLFYSLGGPGGLALFDGNEPVSGDVTNSVSLWDAGTEINEEPGTGENQVQRQSAPGVGLVERGTVAPIMEVNGYDYPAVSDVIRVTIMPE